MAFGNIKLDLTTDTLIKQLKVVHKHLGNMIEELDNMCPECGSNDIESITLKADNNRILEKKKVCNTCHCGRYD